ncbi:MAG: carboxypeptidase M32 [Candidatus Aramenus sulfurataquae]|jgi:carboxypeptidase Taq|uniref:Metal-dependent carboxypeptidase n=4 Tax=Candidatus Aramenus sulfurataquae TaxID=1326980 RepID=A0AAE3FL69_9CREN|nr:carboxypeptidase M32 [Candidatus Aramenus sulfurataquae]
MDAKEVLEKILREYRRAWSIAYARSLLAWDLETYMPQEGARARGEALANLSTLYREKVMALERDVEGLKDEDLDDFGRGVKRVLGREIKYFRAVPPEIDEELNRTTSEAEVAWRKAKKEGKFSEFRPYLEKIVDLERKIAERLGYEGHPYNALLDLYEEGLTVNDVDSVFSYLLPELKHILEKVRSEGRFPSKHELEGVEYKVEDMEKVNREVIEMLEMPMTRFRLDVSPHPFTIRISADDVRITTRYEGKDFRSTMFSVIHESGHAMYELMIDKSMEFTPLGQGVSSGIHESQSRFWENIIGRSREFVHLVYPILKRHLKFLTQDEEELYKYFNVVRPSLIRVDADELTYNFHIAVRYEIEKKLIAGEMSASDVPSMWYDLMDKYLGVRPSKDSEGALQDIHWSQGSFGYFPTYTIGNVVAGILYYHFPVKEKVRDGKLNDVKEYLREKVCKYGATYPPKELLRKSFREGYNPKYLVDYLREKYLA